MVVEPAWAEEQELQPPQAHQVAAEQQVQQRGPQPPQPQMELPVQPCMVVPWAVLPLQQLDPEEQPCTQWWEVPVLAVELEERALEVPVRQQPVQPRVPAQVGQDPDTQVPELLVLPQSAVRLEMPVLVQVV